MNTELAALMPTAEEFIRLKGLCEDMSKFQSITIQLQEEWIQLTKSEFCLMQS